MLWLQNLVEPAIELAIGVETELPLDMGPREYGRRRWGQQALHCGCRGLRLL